MQSIYLRIYPDPILSVPCTPISDVTDEIRELAQEMIQLMVEGDGVGIAGPQVGVSLRICVVDPWWIRTGSNSRALVLINPVLSAATGSQRDFEGCLSIPGVRETVTRHESIHVEALGLNEPVSLDATGFLARVIQHEVDHLDGVVFLDRLEPLSKRMVNKRLIGRAK